MFSDAVSEQVDNQSVMNPNWHLAFDNEAVLAELLERDTHLSECRPCLQ